jgi:hypothetical protein
MRALLAGPTEIVIDGAVSYWLGTPVGEPLGPESDRTLAPCALALRLAADGTDPEHLVLWARLASGTRYQVGGGVDLVAASVSAADVPIGLGRPANRTLR